MQLVDNLYYACLKVGAITYCASFNMSFCLPIDKKDELPSSSDENMQEGEDEEPHFVIGGK